MTILTQTMNNVTKNFKETINKYDLNNLFSNGVINDFNHYINMIKFIDDVSSTFSVSLYENFLYKIDEAFFNSSYRKQFCEVINLPKRTLITFYGEVTFKRRRYYDRNKKKEFCFVDEVLSLPSYISLDPFVCAKICEVSSHSSYAKTGKIVSEMIGKRMKFNDDPSREIISRALARNVVLNFKIPDIPYTLKETPKILYVMLDEKWVHSQYNDDEDYMVKAAVVFENADLVYKYKKKKDSENRIELLGKQVLASIDNDLQQQVLDYIYYSYDTDQIDEIVFMGDCASWVKTFHRGFKFHPHMKITVSIDGYHLSQAIQHICTSKYNHFTDSFNQVIKSNDKQGFKDLCNQILEYEPTRLDTIVKKQDYILNNWRFIQTYFHKVFVKCSMEAHISHCFADLFTARPRAYSEKGLRQLLKPRLLKVNNIDIQKVYFEVLNNEYENKNILDLSSLDGNSNPNLPEGIRKVFNSINNNKLINI